MRTTGLSASKYGSKRLFRPMMASPDERAVGRLRRRIREAFRPPRFTARALGVRRGRVLGWAGRVLAPLQHTIQRRICPYSCSGCLAAGMRVPLAQHLGRATASGGAEAIDTGAASSPVNQNSMPMTPLVVGNRGPGGCISSNGGC